MKMVQLVLIGPGGILDSIPLQVKDPEDCAREVLAAMTRAKWVLSVGDRVELQP